MNPIQGRLFLGRDGIGCAPWIPVIKPLNGGNLLHDVSFCLLPFWSLSFFDPNDYPNGVYSHIPIIFPMVVHTSLKMVVFSSEWLGTPSSSWTKYRYGGLGAAQTGLSVFVALPCNLEVIFKIVGWLNKKKHHEDRFVLPKLKMNSGRISIFHC